MNQTLSFEAGYNSHSLSSLDACLKATAAPPTPHPARIICRLHNMLHRLILLSLPLCGLIALATDVLGQRADSSAANPQVKNVILIVADDLKASVLGCYGDKLCQTPNLDRLAREGMVFGRAYCQGTSCQPSRTSFMHSRYRDRENLTLGEQLQNHGRNSTRIGKIFHMRVPGDIIAGTDGKDHPECWTERFNSPGPEAHTPGDYACLNLNIFTRDLANRQSTRMPHRMFVSVHSDGDGTRQADYKSASTAVNWLRRDHDTPFFLAVGMVRPHYPMVAPRQDFARYAFESIQMPPNWKDDTQDIPKIGRAKTNNLSNAIGKLEDNQKRMWAAYYASVTFMDRQVGRILDELDRSPRAKETAVVFTSDHGYHLGEHGFWQKSNLHEEVLRVPLIVRVPGMAGGQTRSLTELVDLYPTICELMDVPVPEAVQGTSLIPVLKDPKLSVKDRALSFQNGTSLRTDRWHYMLYSDGSDELYDMNADPGEMTNLSGLPEHDAVRSRLQAKLHADSDHLAERKTQR